jgi:alkanesulfonate monooxygenase SsuD/methylene tetrahydromethanopterin reductase-like flavin-dependent oxidoreductase (luciferase family)
MPESQTHPWVEEFRHRVGWGLQAFALPQDPTPAASILAAGRAADALGLDAFFIGDHPAYAPDAWLHLGVLAVQTRSIRLGSVVLCSGYRSPVLNARLAADLDNLSQGRVILGLGHGWNSKEFAQLGLPYPPVPDRQEALEEAVQIIRGVWGPQPFTFHGKHHFTVEEQVAPPPVQQLGPPLILAGSGEKTALRLVAKYADACNFGSGHATGLVRTFGEVRRKNDILDQFCLEENRDPRSVLRSHFTSWLMLAPTEQESIAKRDRYYPDGLSEEQEHSRVIGTPEQAANYYQGLVDAGMQYLVVQILDATDLETVELLARELVPQVTSATA